MPRQVVQSYKKVLNIIPTSRVAQQNNEVLVIGVDSVAAGQTSNIDPNVPTGAIIKYIEVQLAVINLSPSAAFINTAFQYKLDGQSVADPIAIGGDARRNQVLHQSMFGIGADQNNTRTYRLKIPKKFQRLREGMQWVFVFRNSETISVALQVIYKFYR